MVLTCRSTLSGRACLPDNGRDTPRDGIFHFAYSQCKKSGWVRGSDSLKRTRDPCKLVIFGEWVGPIKLPQFCSDASFIFLLFVNANYHISVTKESNCAACNKFGYHELSNFTDISIRFRLRLRLRPAESLHTPYSWIEEERDGSKGKHRESRRRRRRM